MLICQMTDLHIRPPGKPANRVVETNVFANVPSARSWRSSRAPTSS